MRKIKGIGLLCVFFIVGILQTRAQDSTKYIHTIGAIFISEHINIPFENRLGEKHHLGGILNFEISKQRDGGYQFGHNINLGYFVHKEFFEAYFINYKPTFSLRILKTVQLDLPIGLGYAHSLSTEQSYALNGGIYEKSKPKGKPHFMPSLGVGITLRLHNVLQIPMALFSQYEMFLLTPYAPKGSLPFTVHTSLNFGLKIQIK